MSFLAGISAGCAAKSTCQGNVSKAVRSVSFMVTYQVHLLRRKVPFLGSGGHIPLSFQPPAGFPVPPPVSHCDLSFPCWKRLDSARRGMDAAPPPARCLPKPGPRSPTVSRPVSFRKTFICSRIFPDSWPFSQNPLSQPHLLLLVTTPSPPLDLSIKGRRKMYFVLSLGVPNVFSSISYCSGS